MDETSLPPSPKDIARILVVEDNPDWAQLLARILGRRPEPGPVDIEGTLAGALRSLGGLGAELVFLDLNLPDSHGLETLRRIRQASSAAIVVMTGDAEEGQALQGLREGAQDYLIKGKLEAAAILRTARYALERRCFEKEAEASRNLLASTLDALPACIAILDQAGRVKAVNGAWTQASGPGNPLVHGVAPGADYLEVCARKDPRSPEGGAVGRGIRQVLEGHLDRFEMDHRSLLDPGTAWHNVVVTRFTAEGAPLVLVFHLDISSRKQLEGRLRASQDLFNSIANHVQDLMAIIDAQGRRLYTSPSYLTSLGYDVGEMARFTAAELIHPDDRAQVSRAMDNLFALGRSEPVEYRLRHKDGSWRHFDSNGSLIAAEPGQPSLALVVARDVTERRKVEQERLAMEVQLRQSQKLEAVGQLAAGIAHEINTPTQYIGDNTVFLRDSVADLVAFARLVKTCCAAGDVPVCTEVKAACDRLDMGFLETELPRAIAQSLEGVGRISMIVNAMKTFSHPGGEAMECVDLNRSIESTVTVSRNEWRYVAEMELDLDPELPSVPCYPGEFNQVVLNLVVNAAHAIEEDRGQGDKPRMGRIRISTRLEEGQVAVRVQDTGAGIPEAVRARIFDPFFTTKPVGKGTGQGLAIAHHVIVEKHKGRVEVASEVGRGTTFTLLLPTAFPGEGPEPGGMP